MVTVSEIARFMENGKLTLFFEDDPVRSIAQLHALTREAMQVKPHPGAKWKAVVGYEGVYSVSDFGDVRRDVRSSGTYAGRILAQYTDPRGAKTVRLSRPGEKSRNYFVHRLVAEAFLGPPPPQKEYVLHEDDNPSNNELGNLKWGDQFDNMADMKRNKGHYYSNREECPKGHPLTGDNVKPRGGGESGRRCVQCTRERQREWQRKQKQSIA